MNMTKAGTAALIALLYVSPAAAAAQAIDTRLADAAMKRDVAAVKALVAQRVDVNAPGKDSTPPLHWIVRVDDIETARLLIGAGANVKQANRYGVTPLFLACANGNAAMIRLLVDGGADVHAPDQAGETPLMVAARVGDLDSVKLLVDRGAVVDAKDQAFQQTALMVAVRENHPAVVQYLVEKRADVNARTRTGQAPPWILPNSVPGFGHGIGIIRGGLPDRGSRYLIPGGMTPLLYAARDGRVDSARILVAAGADVNQLDPNGITPLIMSIGNNHMDTARFFVEKGSAINAVDWYGRTPLWTAVETRNMDVDNGEPYENGVDRQPVLDMITLLLARGADPNARTKEAPPIRRQMLRTTGTLEWVDFTGQTPFLTAARAADLDVMQLLLDWGADPYITTFGATTPLMAAAGINWVVDQTYDEGPKARLEAVKFCHALGMSVNDVNSMGLSAVMGAANRGSDDIIQFLVDKGARLDVKDKENRTPLNWAEGVFLATHPGKAKPGSMALIKKLMGSGQTAQR